jgi:hypothetical protein
MGSAEVWGAVGTWVIGVLALAIAALQYAGAVFWPSYVATIGPTEMEGGPRRIVVELRNRGGASGMVHDVSVVPTGHTMKIRVSYENWASRPPFPFVLPGRGTAVVVLDLEEPYRKQYRVLITDARGKTCVKPRLTDMVLPGDQTALPPDSLAIRRPPPD